MSPGRFVHLLLHPFYTARLIAYRVYEWRHPDEPWIAQGAVRFCDQHVDRTADALEWGSGRSTAWFAARVRRITSIEYDAGWCERVRASLCAAGVGNADVVHIPVEHGLNEPTHARYDPTPRYVASADGFNDGSLGLIVIDGHYRQACVLAAIPKLAPGGYLLIDNSDRIPRNEWGVPTHWPVVHESRNVRTQTTIWQKPQ